MLEDFCAGCQLRITYSYHDRKLGEHPPIPEKMSELLLQL